MENNRTDEANAQFWKNLGQTFLEAKELILKKMDELGIVITEEDLEASSREINQIRKNAEVHPLAILTKKYYQEARPLLGKIQPEEIGKELINKVEMNLIDQSSAFLKLESLKENMEVIQWYLFFIHVKIMRAIKSQMHDYEKGDLQSDYNGSAKIAKIAAERSLNAWISLVDTDFFEIDIVLETMALLQRSIKEIDHYFPENHLFVRPGFDQI